uniref:Uncharacterized protein n=1 Tax=viral metagenome TaxID=1070528 RepID=A0A6M3K408_9ZZZZ
MFDTGEETIVKKGRIRKLVIELEGTNNADLVYEIGRLIDGEFISEGYATMHLENHEARFEEVDGEYVEIEPASTDFTDFIKLIGNPAAVKTAVENFIVSKL